MKNMTALAALFTAVLAAAPAFASEDCPPAITVSGQATVAVAPDLARIDAGVATIASTAKQAAEANNVAMGKVVQALSSAGIGQKDVQTSGFSLQPQYEPSSQYKPGQTPVITGFRASNRVSVTIRDLARVSGVIDTLVGAGANDIGNISFEVSQTSAVLDSARGQAIADARRKAEIYAKTAGVALGAPISISEGGSALPMPFARAGMLAMASPTPIATGETTLSVTVHVSWAIIKGNAE